VGTPSVEAAELDQVQRGHDQQEDDDGADREHEASSKIAVAAALACGCRYATTGSPLPPLSAIIKMSV
jgi:hypothetical protein